MLRNYSNILPVVAVSFLLALINIQSGHAWGGDFSLYIAQAKSILTGNTHELYLMNKFSMDHSELPLGPYLYPMGYPALLAPAYHFFGLNFIALKVYNLLFFIGTIPLVFSLLGSIGTDRRLVFFSTFLYAINYQLIYAGDRLGSEFSFMFFAMLSLYLMLKSRKSESMLLAAGLGLSVFASFSIRVTGMVLLPTMICFQVVEILRTKQFNWKKNLIPYLVFGICWLGYTRFFESIDDRYMEVFEVTPASLWFTLTGFGEHMVEFVLCLKYFPNIMKIGAAIFFYTLFAIGLRGFFRRDQLFLLGFCSMILGLHLIVPFCDIRFLFVITPFIIYSFLQGLFHVGSKIRWIPGVDKIKVIAYSMLFLGFAQSFVTISVQAIKDSNKVLDTEMEEIYAYINEFVPDEKVIVFHKPRVLRLFTKNNGIFVHDYQSEQAAVADLFLIKTEENPGAGFQVCKEWKSFKLMERQE